MHYYEIDQIVSTTHTTVNKLLEYKNGPDALALYFRYIQQRKMQENNVTYSTDVFMISAMGRGKERFYKAKSVLSELMLIEQIQKRNESNKILGYYVKVNFIMKNGLNTSTLPDSQTLEKPVSGKQETNTLIVNTNTLIVKEKYKYSEEKDNLLKDTYTQIYNYWNEQGVIMHKSFTKQMQKWIDKRLEEYSIEDIKLGIKNYADVVKSNDTYFTHKRTLQEFLQREGGLGVFICKGINDYLKKGVVATEKLKLECALEFNENKTEETFNLFCSTYPKGGDMYKSKQEYLKNPNDAGELQKHAHLMSLNVKYGSEDARFLKSREKWLSENYTFNENYYTTLYKKMGECMGKKTPFTPDQMRSDIDFIFKAYPGLKGVYTESRTYWLERIALEKEKNPFK